MPEKEPGASGPEQEPFDLTETKELPVLDPGEEVKDRERRRAEMLKEYNELLGRERRDDEEQERFEKLHKLLGKDVKS